MSTGIDSALNVVADKLAELLPDATGEQREKIKRCIKELRELITPTTGIGEVHYEVLPRDTERVIRLQDLHQGDVVARRTESPDLFEMYKVLRRMGHLVEVMDLSGRTWYYAPCDFCYHWKKKDGDRLHLHWPINV